MAMLQRQLFKGSQAYEMCPPTNLTYDIGEGYRDDHYQGYQDENVSPIVSDSISNHFSFPSSSAQPKTYLGTPTAKKKCHKLYIFATSISFTCLGLAVAAVANNAVSWRLGRKNYQLVVLGFLLSIMNLCLNTVAPNLFLLLEARFGPSTLQNYDGILRNQILSSQLNLMWRVILSLMLALPLGLSAAYKGFQGGQSVMVINATSYITNASYYGMFAPPGIQGLGQNIGISLFANATLPFAVASAPRNGSEPPVPSSPQSYGFNLLLLNKDSTAMLDAPQPSYVSSIQKLLAPGESWNLTASVLATVATFNQSKTTDKSSYDAFFSDFCNAATASSGAYKQMSMLNDHSVVLLSPVSYSDQSQQFIGLTKDPGIEHQVPCDEFYDTARLYKIDRQFCEGTWSITRGGIQLADGICNGSVQNPVKQLPITRNTLFLPVWYMSSLVEFVGPFATKRSESEWVRPYVATGVAAMLWSRITALNSAEAMVDINPLPLDVPQRQDDNGKDVSFEQEGMLYPVDDYAMYIRPTLRKSVWLYTVLAVQPLLTAIMLALTCMLYSTPVDKGFGLVSILSGIDVRSLDSLTGATLSGKLTTDVKLLIHTVQDAPHRGKLQYRLVQRSSIQANGRLARKVVYH